MIECIFSIDYEIYGNGQGSLDELVYRPMEKLREVFDRRNAKIVNFIEVAELQIIGAHNTDDAIGKVLKQIRELHLDGHEIDLHLHPQWYNAKRQNGQWELDYSEYNLCLLPPSRIEEIVDTALAYIRKVLADPDYTPPAFRAGNWLFQPTERTAKVLSDRGIAIDSSVFKGGFQSANHLDYRKSQKNGYHWMFREDVNVPSEAGNMLEVPIHTELVPFWRMITTKRLGLQKKSATAASKSRESSANKWSRFRDCARSRYPLKFDFCRMTFKEMRQMVENMRIQDAKTPRTYKPMVSIGHTKDLVEFKPIDDFLSYLNDQGIRVATFKEIHEMCFQSPVAQL